MGASLSVDAAEGGPNVPATFVTVRDIPLGELSRFPGNARRGDVAAIRESVRRHGQYRALVVRDTGSGLVILAGNHTRDALDAEGLGFARCEVITCGDDEARRINLADNRLAELGGYDDADLVALLSGLDGDFGGTGWAQEDLDALLAEEPESRTDLDDVPEPPVEPVTRPGDVWMLGPHRLLCGDATSREDVTRLLAGERPDIMVTDPPYGVMYGGDKSKRSISGDLSQAVIPISFAVAVEHLDDDARIYLFGGSGNWQMYASLFDHYLRMQVRAIVWAKESFVLRQNNYHSQFELVYFGWKGKGGDPSRWFGDRKQSDLWSVTRQEGAAKLHPTQKPVEVCAIPVRNSCPPGGLIYEPFGGSGSVLIAAHQTGRVTRIMELDPAYCDVICQRYADHTGVKPVLVEGDK